jgi:hypothetical protein
MLFSVFREGVENAVSISQYIDIKVPMQISDFFSTWQKKSAHHFSFFKSPCFSIINFFCVSLHSEKKSHQHEKHNPNPCCDSG